jgi:hypothetical protein
MQIVGLESADKPGSVIGRSFLWDARHRDPQATYPETRQGLTSANPIVSPVSLFGLAPNGVCHASSVARTAVRSYRTVSPLPVSVTRPLAVYSLLHFP